MAKARSNKVNRSCNKREQIITFNKMFHDFKQCYTCR